MSFLSNFAPDTNYFIVLVAGKGTASVHEKVPLVAIAADIFTSAFRANFLPFWAHSMSHRIRPGRLDSVQHEAIHGMNSATKMCNLISKEASLAVQRSALSHTSAGILTVSEVASIFGIEWMRGSSSNGGFKSNVDAVNTLASAGPVMLAKILTFAKIAWLSEELLIVDLGQKTRNMQHRALLKRFGRPHDSCVHTLPVHAAHLCACTECQRVSNAHSNNPMTTHNHIPTPFNEIGLCCSMIYLHENGKSCIRCSKRPSASLRMAISMEGEMTRRRVEAEAVDTSNVNSTFAHQPSVDSGKPSRVRRDAKNTMEQHAVATPCGCQPLLCIPILGKAIRIWNEWFALCTLCGCMMRVFPNNRFYGYICCMRCDSKMLGISSFTETTKTVYICRFCGKVDPELTGTHWKVVKSPRDESGVNTNLPPPLRQVHYCPQHYRTWLTGAHRVLPTRVILSHLAIGAKPVYGAEDAAHPDNRPIDRDNIDNHPKKRRRKSRSVKRPSQHTHE